MILAKVLASVALGLASTQAIANYKAMCQSPGGCSAEACGATPQAARSACLKECPFAEVTSISTSSCTVPGQKPAPTPPSGTPELQLCTARPPEDGSKLVYGPVLHVGPRNQHWGANINVPATPAGRTRQVYCTMNFGPSTGFCAGPSLRARCVNWNGSDGQSEVMSKNAGKQPNGTWTAAVLLSNGDQHTAHRLRLAYELFPEEKQQDEPKDGRSLWLLPIAALAIAGPIWWRRRRQRS
jgi:hypothetical protein